MCSRLLRALLLFLCFALAPSAHAKGRTPVLDPTRPFTAELDATWVGVGGGFGIAFTERVGMSAGVDLGQFLGVPLPWTHDPWPFPLILMRASARVGLGRRSHLEFGPHLSAAPAGSLDLGISGSGYLAARSERTPVTGARDSGGSNMRVGAHIDLRLGSGRPLWGPRLTLDRTADNEYIFVVVPFIARWVK